jgi:ADP-ribose pyrophosphatase
VELVQDLSEISAPVSGFLRRHRHRVKTVMDNGRRTETYVVDYADRDIDRRDAVAVAVYARGKNAAKTRVLLRRQVRYAAYLVTGQPTTVELVAGLIELPESPESCTARELWEEAGAVIESRTVQPLGPPFFPIPGLSTERIVPMMVELPSDTLDALALTQPPGDGSPFEEGAENFVVSLADAFEMMLVPADSAGDRPLINDAKTEIILHRLGRMLWGGP